MASKSSSIVSVQAAPFLHEASGQKPAWLWRITQTAGGKTWSSEPLHRRVEAKRALHDQIVALLGAGHTVEASIVDQTGGGHAQTYVPRGPEPANAEITSIRDIPSKGGLLGPRCNDLPRGAGKTSPGREQGRARQRTLTATRMWSALSRAIRDGTMQADVQGKRVRKVVSGTGARAPWLTVTPAMFRAIGMRAVFESWPGIGSFGRFPIYDELPDDVDAAAQVSLEDIVPPEKKPKRVPKQEAAVATAPAPKPKPKPKPKPVEAAAPPRRTRKPAQEAAPAAPPAIEPAAPAPRRPRRSPPAATASAAPPAPPPAGGGGLGLAALIKNTIDERFESAPKANRRYAPADQHWRR